MFASETLQTLNFFKKLRLLKRNKDNYNPLENPFLTLVPERRTSFVLVSAFHGFLGTPLCETITQRVYLQIDLQIVVSSQRTAV